MAKIETLTTELGAFRVFFISSRNTLFCAGLIAVIRGFSSASGGMREAGPK